MQIQYLNITTYHSNQKWNNEICQCECKNDCTCKMSIVGIIAQVLVRMVSI